ncbi:twin-arginine translocase TatA/TatE family subunit [Dongia soli]|uniref:Sec-independent protein translocase protein TatA n=1 Tax=Dongia soli TaxID=600628 RepID=A0ABU5EFB9_9PROT|nr:twin-arginine translocase TatA/TatE family subunit [Dongia soli]MDY0885100.1 twin-arginine translocase TatA/TatE family subunit [Dongia soli]
MGSFSLWHWLIVLAIVLVLFGGGGKIPRLMKDLGQGITAFKKGLKNDEKPGETQASSASGDDKHGMIDRG